MQPATKVWIKDLITGEYGREEGEFGSQYILVEGKRVSRANIIAPVKDMYQVEGYASITLDDGSASIRAKAWKNDIKFFKNVQIGNVVLLIGKVREYNEERHLVPEVVKVIESQWAFVRKLELIKVYGKKEISELGEEPLKKEQGERINLENEDITWETVSESSSTRQKIIVAIKDLNVEQGAALSEIASKVKLEDSEIKKIIDELLEEGEIYEIKGHFKLTA